MAPMSDLILKKERIKKIKKEILKIGFLGH